MNFFGHAVVATWTSTEPGFVLGAMLPDFATMVGARVPSVTAEVLERGVGFHHDTDRVFHDAPTFRALQSDARKTLRADGLPRASALAVAHIGVEILLDACLASDPRGVEGYLAALDRGAPDALGAHIVWGTKELAARYEELRHALVSRGVSASAGTPAAAAWRVTRALANRPRFRLDADGERVVLAWAEMTAPAVARSADALLNEVLAGLPGTTRPARNPT